MKISKKALISAALGLAALGATTVRAADVDVNADIASSTTWTSNNVYHLKGVYHVLNGATLTIQPGTLIASYVADQGTLVIDQGAKIFANGTKANPIIFTSMDDVATWTGTTGAVINGNGQLVGTPVGLPGGPTGTGHVTAITTYGDPKTGQWRESSKEWGTLVLLGNGLISKNSSGPSGGPITNTVQWTDASSVVHTNTPDPTGNNKGYMEGLVASGPTDQRPLYGGNNDNDSSGALHYISLRYGGNVITVGVELNGLSMGAIGRQTTVDHIDIMNCLDDGIETWGGKVNYKYINIWNSGDDSMDTDEGWRGKAQFGLIVEGYNLASSVGSGISDNAFESDGAEDSNAQPITTSRYYNFTAIGNPQLHTRGGATAWRDNTHLQFRNSVWMDMGQKVVKFDNNDGDNTFGHGYGFGPTWNGGTTANTGTNPDYATFVSCWTTPYTWSTNTALNSHNLNEGANPVASMYDVQVDGNLCEITNCVFFNFTDPNPDGSAHADAAGEKWAESDFLGVTTAGASNTAAPYNIVAASSPITAISREASILTRGGVSVQRVISLNPLPANDALVAAVPSTVADTNFVDAPNDGFFTPAHYRGGFSPTNVWIKGWTAADAYGMVAGATADDPATTIALTSTTTFATTTGFTYVIEYSTDGLNWFELTEVIGDGTIKNVTDYTALVAAKVYRVRVK